MTVKSIDRATCQQLDARIAAALQPLAKELGLVIKMKGGKYSATNILFKVEVSVIAEDGTVATPEAETFKRLAVHYGLQPTDLNREFIASGVSYRITGLNTKRSRFPISAKRCHDGAGFKFSEDTVRNALARS